jgi:hypothetical protein
MKPFDYIKFVSNKTLLKEDKDYVSAEEFDYEPQEGPNDPLGPDETNESDSFDDELGPNNNGWDDDYDSFEDGFENIDDLPKKVQKLVSKLMMSWDDDGVDYKYLHKMLDEFEAIGWTFDFGLDGVPYGLRPKGDQDIEETEIHYNHDQVQDDSTETQKIAEKNYGVLTGGLPHKVRTFTDEETGYEYEEIKITEPIPDDPKSSLVKKLRAAGWHANPNFGGGITATKETGRVVDVNDLEEAAEYGDKDDYYINVSVRDAKAALEILRDQFSSEYRQRIISLDGTNSYVINDREIAMELYDALKDADIEITDTDVEVDDNDWDD